MPDVIVDATILIDASNNHPKALHFLKELLLADEAVTHGNASAELLTGTRDAKEQSKFVKFLRQFRIVHAGEADSESALEYLKKFHLSHDLGFDDCLIGATALRLELPVATINDRHFRLFKGLKVIRPY